MKVAFVFAAALILCVALLGPVQARFEKPKYCVGKNGKHYLRGEHYDDKVKGTCIRYTCVRKGKKLKMAKKKVPCAVEPEPSLKANVTALEGKLEALQNSVESILVMMTALQSTSSQLEINMTANIDAININKESIIVNKEGISVHEDSISSNKDGIASNTDNISVNKDSCSAVQTSADKLKTCLGDVTSKECPSSQNGKVAIVDAIIENEDDIEALGSLHDNTGCCTPTTIAAITTTAQTTTTSPTTTPIGVVGDWSSWSACTATCGNATKTRKRACEIPHCQPFVKEETVKCHLPKCGNSTIFEEERCFFEDTNITFQDLGHNHYGQDHKPEWELSDEGRTLKSALNTRPSAGLSILGSPSSPVSFSGRVFSTSNDDDVMGMVFGYWNETNFFVVASARDGGPTNWYVGRLHATCGESCASETTISDAIWYPQNHPEDITVLATGSTAWQHNEKYNFTICFNPSKLLFNVNVVNVTVEDEAEPVLQTGILSAKTNDSDVDEISRKGGFIGVYVDSQADTTWDNLDCHDCDLDLKEGIKYLGSDLPWVSCSTQYKTCRIDETVYGNDIEIASKTYKKGISAHAASTIEFNLDAGYGMFHACVGIANKVGTSSVRFRVSGDGQVLRDWQRRNGGEDVICFDISLSGVKILKLEADDAGDGINGDHATWAAAYVYQPTQFVGGTWELGGNINPCDGGNFGYIGPWSKGVNVGSSVQAFTKDFIDIDIWKKRAGFVTIARHVDGQCTMSKTWELKDKTRSLYSYFSTYPGRIYATGDGSRSDNHIASDIPQSAEGLTGTWRDPIFGAEGGLVFNWCYGDNGVRIAVPGGYVNPYNLPIINESAENMSGLGNDYHADTKNGVSKGPGTHTGYWYDVGKIGTNCGYATCQFVGTDQGPPLQSNPGDKACWGSYAIFVSQDAMSFNCQGGALTTVEKV